ncbi:hypothetical protein N7507_009757 [Penicillium longicatenatum]|nr:hypothetical protein N7507_009757 [Penicillium longicatenatum]
MDPPLEPLMAPLTLDAHPLYPRAEGVASRRSDARELRRGRVNHVLRLGCLVRSWSETQLVNQTLPTGGPQIESIETGRGLSLGSSETQSPQIGPVEKTETDETVREESQDSTKLGDDDRAISVSGGEKQDFETLCEQQAENEYLPRSAVPSRLHMLMAIGYTTLQRAGEAENIEERPFEPCLQEIFCECVSKVNENSAGTLLLLGLYLLFKPNDLDPRAIVGVLTRHALATGLVSETPTSQKLSPRALELRRRLSWSVYVFDRMIGISYGLPFGIPDDSMQVPLPSIMIHEYGSPEGHQYTIALQVSRHVIALRQLETRIVDSIYHQGPPVHTQELRRQIEDWYTQGCLLSSSALWEQDQVPFHTTITWLNVRYQNLLLLLYTPARADSGGEDNLAQLQAAAQQYIQLSLILHEHRHLPINWITLCRLLSLAAIFFHCITQWSSTFQEIPEINLLAFLLELFEPSWIPAHEAARIMRRLSETIANNKTPIIPLSKSSASSVITSPGLEVELGLQAIQDELAPLISDTLGEASFYIWPLRSKVSDRRPSHQFVATDGMSGIIDGGPRIGIPQNSAFTPADNPLMDSPLETQWMSLLGGLGSDML